MMQKKRKIYDRNITINKFTTEKRRKATKRK